MHKVVSVPVPQTSATKKKHTLAVRIQGEPKGDTRHWREALDLGLGPWLNAELTKKKNEHVIGLDFDWDVNVEWDGGWQKVTFTSDERGFNRKKIMAWLKTHFEKVK